MAGYVLTSRDLDKCMRVFGQGGVASCGVGEEFSRKQLSNEITAFYGKKTFGRFGTISVFLDGFVANIDSLRELSKAPNASKVDPASIVATYVFENSLDRFIEIANGSFQQQYITL